MAIVTTTITPALTLNNWTDTGGIQPNSMQPIGELLAVSQDESITLSGTGDTQEARWSVALPVNYAYVLKDWSVTIDISAANTWVDEQNLIFLTSGTELQTFEYGVGCHSRGVIRGPGTTNQKQFYKPNFYPSFLQFGGGTWQSTFVDLTTEEGAANFNGIARFLVYTETRNRG